MADIPEIAERLENGEFATITDLAYCNGQSEECLTNRCPTCSGDASFDFFMSRIGPFSEEALNTVIGYQIGSQLFIC